MAGTASGGVHRPWDDGVLLGYVQCHRRGHCPFLAEREEAGLVTAMVMAVHHAKFPKMWCFGWLARWSLPPQGQCHHHPCPVTNG